MQGIAGLVLHGAFQVVQSVREFFDVAIRSVSIVCVLIEK
jgi:hypothetical protein